MGFNAQFVLFGAAVLFMSIASYNAFPAELEDMSDEPEIDVDTRQIPRYFVPPASDGRVNAIKAVGFNKNRVVGSQSGNFAVSNATNVLAKGFSFNAAKGDSSGNFKVGRK